MQLTFPIQLKQSNAWNTDLCKRHWKAAYPSTPTKQPAQTNLSRGGSVVECRTPEREVRGSKPTAAVLCPWARHFTPRKYWLITQEAMAPSRHDWKIVDWDVKPQHNQPTNLIVLQTLHAELAPILQVIFQKSLDSGKLPHIWKEANVSSIFKKGDKSDPANYHPISLTCVFCKVLEHIVASNLTKHLTNSDILFELQHGFREKRSCETQLVMLVDEIAKNMQMGFDTFRFR